MTNLNPELVSEKISPEIENDSADNKFANFYMND